MSNTNEIMSVRGRSGQGKEHIGIPPESGTLWSKTACGLTCLSQFPGYWSQASDGDKCWNCKAFHEHRNIT